MSDFCAMKIGQKVIPEREVCVADLLSLLSDDQLKRLCVLCSADKYVIKLGTIPMFKLILYSILDSERISLRTMEANYISVGYQILEESVIGSTTAHSSIRDRLCKINVSFFEKLYHECTSMLKQHYGEKALIGKYNVKRYDSTMISVFSHLLEGMKVGNTSKKKNQIKLTTEFSGFFEVRMRLFTKQDYLGEEVALKEMIQSASHSSKDLIVFDRGIKSRATFCDLKNQKTQFVTRLHENNRQKFIRTHETIATKPTNGLLFLQDSIVNLYGKGSHIVDEEFRVIEAIVEDTGKKIFFLTNILFMSTEEVAELYRLRWDIEVFFRFLKQEMNLTHFVCNDTNAIQVMIYCTMIAAMLVLIYKKLNSVSSYKRAKTQFIKELEAGATLELIEKPGGLERFKEVLRRKARKWPKNSS